MNRGQVQSVVAGCRRGDADAARHHADRVRELAVQLDHPTPSREVLALVGAIAVLGGDVHEALRTGLEALALAVETGDLEGQALAHGNIGVARHLLGDAGGSRDEYHAALHHYGESGAINRRLGRRLQGGMITANTAQILIRLGETAEARRLIHEASASSESREEQRRCCSACCARPIAGWSRVTRRARSS